MEYATRGRFGGLGLKTIGGRFYGFGPQNSDRGSKEERASRGGIKGVRVEAKLSHEGCGGRQMKITSGWTITSSG
jgi:hypothetical protein